MKRQRQIQQKRAENGSVDEDFYNAEDSPMRKEAETDKESFARGGRKRKRKRGGRAEHSPLTRAADVEGRPGGDYGGKPSSREDD